MKAIINCLIIYLLIATFILINFLFNPKIKLMNKNLQTGEEQPADEKMILYFSIFWIYHFIKIFIYKIKNSERRY